MILHASELENRAIRRGPESKMYVDRDCKATSAWSRHVHGITQYKMASNIGRDREIAGLILLFR